MRHGTIFSGGLRIGTKFTKWSLSLKSLRTAGLRKMISVAYRIFVIFSKGFTLSDHCWVPGHYTGMALLSH